MNLLMIKGKLKILLDLRYFWIHPFVYSIQLVLYESKRNEQFIISNISIDNSNVSSFQMSATNKIPIAAAVLVFH